MNAEANNNITMQKEAPLEKKKKVCVRIYLMAFLHLVSKCAQTMRLNPQIKTGFIQMFFPTSGYILLEVIKLRTFCNEFAFNRAY